MTNMTYVTPDRKRKMILVAAGIAVALCILTFFAMQYLGYADVFDNINTTFNEIYTKLGIILTSVAMVAIGICAFKWIFSSDPASVRSAKTWLFGIICGVAIFWLARVIVDTIKTMVQGS